MEFAVYIVLLLVLGAFVTSFGRAFFRGAPYAPTDKRAVATMVRLAFVKPGERACDIGSGDGRLVIALTRAGAETDGFEINRFLVLWSRWCIRRNGLQNRARIIRKNLWKADFRPYTIIALFGIPYIMRGLEEKLLAETKPGTRIVSNRFRFPTLTPVAQEGGVYLYVTK